MRPHVTEDTPNMIDRTFFKRLRLLAGRSETITTRFELDGTGRLVEHVTVQTFDALPAGTTRPPAWAPRRTSR